MAEWYKTYEQAFADIQALEKQVESVAKTINPGVDIITRALTTIDIGYKFNAGLVDIATGDNEITIAEGEVPTNTVIAPYAIVVKNIPPETVDFVYMDFWVGGTRVQRWDLTPILETKSDNEAIFYLPIEKTVIMTQGAKYRVTLRVNNASGSAQKVAIKFLGFVGEPNGRTVTKLAIKR